MQNPPIISLDNVSIHYPQTSHSVIKGVTFSVEKGSLTTLLGPNGAGKSTIIKAILGLAPYTGSISVFGKNINQAHGNIGFVPQRFQFDSNIPITVEEFLDLALITCVDDTTKKSSRINRALKLVNLLSSKQKQLNQLSGGQLQRILLARALIHEPMLLILDEPEAGIDVGAEQSLYQLLDKLRKEQDVTMLIASHELDVVFGFADQVVCVNKKLICTGKPNKVLNEKTFMELYGGDITFYTHGHSH